MTDDRKIIELFNSRTEEAIKALSEKYGAVCRIIAQNILKNDLDAEECVNDAYLAVWNTIPPQNPDPLRTYVYRIVRNISVKKYHANKSLKRNSHYDVALDELDACIADAMTVEKEISAKELSRQINIFLGTLDNESRIMFVRRYWYSDRLSEIAERFKISENNAAVRLSRLRDKLKQHLKKEGYEI